MANNKSTPVIVIGAAVFIVGAGLAFVLLHGSSKTKTTKTPTASAVTTTTLGPNSVVVGSSATTPSAFAFQIPAGKNAVAVQVGALAGLDGFAKAGDVINIYANVKGRIPGPLLPPLTKLIASDVQVLEVLSPGPTSAPTGTAVYLLALDPVTAEQIIFFNTNESLYFTLVPKNAPPALTPGRSYQNAA